MLLIIVNNAINNNIIQFYYIYIIYMLYIYNTITIVNISSGQTNPCFLSVNTFIPKLPLHLFWNCKTKYWEI